MLEKQNIEYVKCNVCEEDCADHFFIENGYSVVKCQKCGLVYVNPRPINYDHKTEDIKEDQYNCYIREYIANRNSHEYRSREILKNILKLKPTRGKLLEIGCAAGFFLKTARDMGWSVEGVEPEELNAKYAIDKLNLDVNITPIESMQLPVNHFDIIVALNVLSHLKDPKEFFKKIRVMLKSDGLFVFETGNKGGLRSKWQGEILGETWLTPEHMYHFSEKSLALMIKDVGFKEISLSTTSTVDLSLSKGVLSLNRSTRLKWILKRLLTRFDWLRIMLASLLKLFFNNILSADVSSLLYIVEKD